jgi:hypothetical protein
MSEKIGNYSTEIDEYTKEEIEQAIANNLYNLLELCLNCFDDTQWLIPDLGEQEIYEKIKSNSWYVLNDAQDKVDFEKSFFYGLNRLNQNLKVLKKFKQVQN